MTEQRWSADALVIGAGPAGLMAAECLSRGGYRVNVYDAMPSAGRKFLMAGKGGMNITHAEPFESFCQHFSSPSGSIAPILQCFSPIALRQWLSELGIETFVGTSGRVFPVDMKAAPLLRLWLHRLRMDNVQFYMRHRWLGWGSGRELRFETESGVCEVSARVVILALGGGSWSKLGSDGAWVSYLVGDGIAIEPLAPANCGFECEWSDFFRQHFQGSPLKKIGIRLLGAGLEKKLGEALVTSYGLEGSLIYALSSDIRKTLDSHGIAELELDLLPDLSLEEIETRLNKPMLKVSLANRLRKQLGFDPVKTALLREQLSPDDSKSPEFLAKKIKSLVMRVLAPRPLDESISSAGGVRLDQLDADLMLFHRPGIFCAGEMLDWEAPTGGYLLTACLATGKVAGDGALKWLAQRNGQSDI